MFTALHTLRLLLTAAAADREMSDGDLQMSSRHESSTTTPRDHNDDDDRRDDYDDDDYANYTNTSRPPAPLFAQVRVTC